MNHVAPSTRPLMKRALAAMAKHKAQEAVNLLQEVLALNPNHAEALHNIAFVMHSAGNYGVALDYYQRAINADPTYIESYLELSRVLQSQNRADDAIAVAQRATQVAPNNPSTYLEVAGLLFRFWRADEAPAYLEQIIPHFPDNIKLQQYYCLALQINDRFEEAEAAYQALISKHRVPASFRFQYRTFLPKLYTSDQEIDRMRDGLKKAIADFIAEKPRINIAEIGSNSLFYLAFHNRDNKEILQNYTRMLRLISPELNYVAPHCKGTAIKESRPLRIGFISANMHNHSVGNCYRNIMIALARDPDFSVTFFNLADVMDAKMQEIINAGIPVVSMPKHIETAQQTVASHTLDVLIYTDIGMEATTHYMAMARLAPYQVCLLGHPETTGIDTIDYVVSSRSYEPPHADDNYSERLLCNEGVDTIFIRPLMPERWMTREELGLPSDKKLYVCPMTIQKFHPDFDDVLADILAKDPNAILVLFNDSTKQNSSQLLRQQRLLSKCDASRIVFLPWLPIEKLFSVIKTCDAVLDTIYFGGGTTAQFSFGLGIPIVTMPGHYARGRVVYSYYSIMGIDHAPIASDTSEYVKFAIKLANDKEYAATLSSQIVERNHLLFETAPYAPRFAQLMRDIVNQQLDGYQR